jgi:Domain of unknown function DUF29
MDGLPDYDADILAWSERQAALLRGLRPGALGLPNELDLENIAEEIESVGRSQLAAVESHLVNLMIHAAKAVSSPSPYPQRGWRAEIARAQAGAASAFSPSMAQRIDLDRLWRRALRQARLDLEAYDEPLVPLPETCPFTLDALLDEQADPDRILERLRPPAAG